MESLRIIACIPARWNSTRLPGKPLVRIAGRTLLSRVVDQVRRDLRERPDIEVVIASDDDRVLEEGSRCGCRGVMTGSDISSGSGRTLAAVRMLERQPDAVLNIQGDAPFFPSGCLLALVNALGAGARVATPVVQLTWSDLDSLRRHKAKEPFSGTTCIVDDAGHAVWFSKQVIPAIRNETALRATKSASPVYRHVGIYGYRLEALTQFENAPCSSYELIEGLEQLRLLQMGIPIAAVPVASAARSMGGIDTPSDVRLAEDLLMHHGDLYGT